MSPRLVQNIPKFAQDGSVRFFLADPMDRRTDSLAGLKFEAGSSGGVSKDAFKALHPLDSGTFKEVETGHALRSSSSGTRPGSVTCGIGSSPAARS